MSVMVEDGTTLPAPEPIAVPLAAILDEMWPILKYTRVTAERFDVIKRLLINNHDDVDFVKALSQAIVDFRFTEFSELHRIFRLPIDTREPIENAHVLWQRYFANGRYALPEMKLFRSQAKLCLEKWLLITKEYNAIQRKKHAAKKKEAAENHQNDDPENAAGISNGPEAVGAAANPD